jgi:hypothetical protein
MFGMQLLHQKAEIEARRAASDTDDAHGNSFLHSVVGPHSEVGHYFKPKIYPHPSSGQAIDAACTAEIKFILGLKFQA